MMDDKNKQDIDENKIKKDKEDKQVDEASDESFPASDPPSWTPTAAK